MVVGFQINHKHSRPNFPPKEIHRKKWKERRFNDTCIETSQMSTTFIPLLKLLKVYLERRWSGRMNLLCFGCGINIYNEKKKKVCLILQKKSFRLGLIQWQMRLYKGFGRSWAQAGILCRCSNPGYPSFWILPISLSFFNAPFDQGERQSSCQNLKHREQETHAEIVKRFLNWPSPKQYQHYYWYNARNKGRSTLQCGTICVSEKEP